VRWQPATKTRFFCFLKLITDNGKLVEKQGRKAKGPVKWQPATKIKFFYFFAGISISYKEAIWNYNKIIIDTYLK
jgi:hypothetical protein